MNRTLSPNRPGRFAMFRRSAIGLACATLLLPLGALAAPAPTPKPTPETPAAPPRPIPFPSFSSPGVQHFLRRFRPLLAPGPLSLAHAEFETPDGCDRCHSQDLHAPLDRSRCLACHKTLADRKNAGTNLHATLFQGGCIACHREHKGRNRILNDLRIKPFPHDKLTSYSLTGQHAPVPCSACHAVKDASGKKTPRRRYLLGTGLTCADCHDSPHEDKITRPCTDCHTTEGFDLAASKFDHNHMTPFPLAGLHATQDCGLCHPDLTFQPQGGPTCTACHSDVEAFYAGKAFPALAPSRADTMHETVHCQDCHSIADAKGEDEPVRERCIACHTPRITMALDAELEMLVARLKALPPATANDPQYKPVVEAIWKHAPHNTIYAGKLLRALEVKAVGK